MAKMTKMVKNENAKMKNDKMVKNDRIGQMDQNGQKWQK